MKCNGFSMRIFTSNSLFFIYYFVNIFKNMILAGNHVFHIFCDFKSRFWSTEIMCFHRAYMYWLKATIVTSSLVS